MKVFRRKNLPENLKQARVFFDEHLNVAQLELPETIEDETTLKLLETFKLEDDIEEELIKEDEQTREPTSQDNGDTLEVFVYDFVDIDLATEYLQSYWKYSNVKVHLNTFGGSFHGAVSFVSLFRNAKIHSVIEGINFSAGTIISSSSEVVDMANSGLMLIHNPLVVAVGDYIEFAKQKEVLEKLADSLAGIYENKSKQAGKNIPKKVFRELMDKETWLSAEDALELGLVDSIFEKQLDEDAKNIYEEVKNVGIETYIKKRVKGDEPKNEPKKKLIPNTYIKDKLEELGIVQ